MQVIQGIRDRAAWIISILIGVALIAFIVQDASVRGGSIFRNTTDIAVVNDVAISKTDFDNKVETIVQMQGAQAQREQLSASVYNMMVQQTILEQEYAKLGMQVTGKELSDILFGANPPQWLQQAFTDPNTGVFNAEMAKQQFAQMKKNSANPQVAAIVETYIEPTMQQALAMKYQALIMQAVSVPKWMAEKINADNNSVANMQYVYVPYTTIVDSTIKVTDADVDAYVKKHKAEFMREYETRTVSYVSFDANPTAADSAVVYSGLASLKSEFAAATDDKSFVAAKGSETNFLDAFVTSNNLKVPNADSIKGLAVGQVYGPYLDANNYTLAKMVAKRSMPDSVKVRHILVKTGQGGIADSVAKNRIDSIKNAVAAGANFNELVKKYSDDPGSKDKGGEYEFASVGFANLSKEFAEVAFYGTTGDKKVVKVENSSYSGYHYIEVLSQKNTQPAYKIAYISKPILASTETVNAANDAATKFAGSSKDKKAFDDNAAKLNKFPMPTGDIQENDFQVPGLGSNRTFIRWIYENKVGTVSEPKQFDGKYVVAIITSVSPAGLATAAAARPQAEMFIRNEKKAQQIIANKLKGTTLEAMAQAAGTSVQRADSVAFEAGFIPGVGAEPRVLGAAFNKTILNKVSTPIAGASGVFVVKPDAVGARAALATNIEDLRKRLADNTRNQVSYRSMEALRLAASIKDLRSDFY
jgi:peptidyl-prolyl cis-trans isomerase D